MYFCFGFYYWGNKLLSQRENEALKLVSSRLGVSPTKLKYLIEFESKWNPKIKNPYSSARGLIQFVDNTARGLGYANSFDLVQTHPTREGQLLGPVYNYLKKYKPFVNDQSLFMSVFYPKARYWPSNKEFPAYVQKVNPGIRTPSDYVRKVYTRLGIAYVSPIAIVAIVGISFYIYRQQKGK